MEKDKYILEELMDVSPLLVQIEKTNVYSVSSLFFNELCAEVMNKIHLGIEPNYYFPPTMPFAVPENYFEHLPGKILQKALGERQQASNEVFEEMEEISPLLNTISKKPVFSVPEGYFTEVQKPTGRLSTPEAKVKSIKVAQPRLMRYAAAAVIAALMVIGAFLLIGKDSLPSQPISNSSNVDVKDLSKQDIMEFLKTTSMPGEVPSAPINSTIKEHELKNILKGMTDEEIKQFLEKNEVPGDI